MPVEKPSTASKASIEVPAVRQARRYPSDKGLRAAGSYRGDGVSNVSTYRGEPAVRVMAMMLLVRSYGTAQVLATRAKSAACRNASIMLRSSATPVPARSKAVP